MSIALHIGDCRAVLPTLPDASVHCVVTSPPYWGLRDYGTATWQGGDAGCDHRESKPSRRANAITTSTLDGGKENIHLSLQFKGDCGHCGAVRIDNQLGLEPDFNAYVAAMVAVFREVRRVLRDDGTCWINLGDSYASGGRGGGADGSKQQTNIGSLLGAKQAPDGLKPKDLCGIPWRAAFALQADGWYLRQDIIWAKPNPMPESVTDRCTKAHEYLFLLSKRERYYYDAEAIAEPSQEWKATEFTVPNGRNEAMGLMDPQQFRTRGVGTYHSNETRNTRNKRSVWEVATAPFSEAHFATFPPALIEPCIKAGTSEKGCCGKCGKPWVRQTEIERRDTRPNNGSKYGDLANDLRSSGETNIAFGLARRTEATVTTTGWSPSCACAADPVPCTVLDPFGGAGTTGLVADRLQRNAILIELNPAYAAMSENRIKDDAPLFVEMAT